MCAVAATVTEDGIRTSMLGERTTTLNAAGVMVREPKEGRRAMTKYPRNSNYREPKGAWKTDVLAILLIFAATVVAVATFLR
jgi:hypothetical protein